MGEDFENIGHGRRSAGLLCIGITKHNPCGSDVIA